ncbi:MAG: hypothetical protein RIB57_07775 [Pelagibacterium sp.]|uniref:hypothetical protein n=1 Tax=Pelagibacterium sp. TaxID=1967288 RepID=UPI0032EC8AAF
MPKKSKSELELLNAGLIDRPKAEELVIPVELATVAEREAYKAIFDGNPSPHLFTDAAKPLMIAYVRNALAANELSAVIADADAQADIKAYLALIKMQTTVSSAIASLSTKLRISPSSIAEHRGNLIRKDEGPKPWEDAA